MSNELSHRCWECGSANPRICRCITALTASPQAAPEGETIPRAAEFLASMTPPSVASHDWELGWNACRFHFPRTASPQVQGVIASWRNSLAGCLGLAEEGGDAKVSYAIGVLDKIAEELAETCQQGAVAVKYEARKRPKWDDNAPWSKWEECTREAYELCLRQRPSYGEWRYEARAVYASPQVQGGEAPFAWGAPDGRVIEAKAKEAGERAGGATKSATSIFNIPLYATPQNAPGVTEEMVDQALATLDNGDWCDRGWMRRALEAALASGPSGVDGTVAASRFILDRAMGALTEALMYPEELRKTAEWVAADLRRELAKGAAALAAQDHGEGNG
jgi:hypothetical protein